MRPKERRKKGVDHSSLESGSTATEAHLQCCLTPLDARERGKKNRNDFSCGLFAFLCADDFWKAFTINEHNFFTQIRQPSVSQNSYFSFSLPNFMSLPTLRGAPS